MNDTPRASGYFAKLATVLLRIAAVIEVGNALMQLISMARWNAVVNGSDWTMQIWLSPVLCVLGGLLLWLVSVPFGRLIARGLDD